MSDHPKVAGTDHIRLVEGRPRVDFGTQEQKRNAAAGSVAAGRRSRSDPGARRVRSCRVVDAAMARVPDMRRSGSGDGFCG